MSRASAAPDPPDVPRGDLRDDYRRALDRVRSAVQQRISSSAGAARSAAPGLGRLAQALQECGDRGLAERARAWLEAQGSAAHGDDAVETIAELSEALRVLESIHRRIAAAFDGQVAGFEDRIRRGDGRFGFLIEQAGPLAGRIVLDAGCGRGALGRALLTAWPTAELWAMDLSPEMLAHVPAAARARQGSLQDIPFEDARFDVVFCVEALEHACNPEGAVAELCRVTRPGGRVLIVDKNAERAGALQVEAWERWFQRAEVEGWLSRACRDVRSAPLVHCPELGPDLFIGWSGTRR